MNEPIRQVTIEYVDAKTLFGEIDKLKSMVEELSGRLLPQQPIVYLSRKEVAERFGVSEVTINNWRNLGILKGYTVCNRVRYIESEVLNAPIPISRKK